MALPGASSLCVSIVRGSQELCVTLPGGASVCVQYPLTGVPDPSEVAKQLLAQLNVAMAPLVPIFNVLDVVMQIVECVKATTSVVRKPWKLIKCLPELGKRVGRLLPLIPQASVPIMIGQALDVLIAYLQGTRSQLVAFVSAQAAIASAATRAAELGNVEFAAIIDCATAQLNVQMAVLNEGVAPLNRLLALVNLFLRLIGKPVIPDLGSYGSDPSAALEPLDAAVRRLQHLRQTYPLSS